jgi:hypothetical protein
MKKLSALSQSRRAVRVDQDNVHIFAQSVQISYPAPLIHAGGAAFAPPAMAEWRRGALVS